MDVFTESERNTINSIYAREFEGLTSDEVRLLIRWEVNNALISDEYRRNVELQEKESQERIHASETLRDAALDNLIELRNKALEMFEASNGS